MNGYTESSAKIAYRWQKMKEKAQSVAVKSNPQNKGGTKAG
jgi:hypothetical protein